MADENLGAKVFLASFWNLLHCPEDPTGAQEILPVYFLGVERSYRNRGTMLTGTIILKLFLCSMVSGDI